MAIHDWLVRSKNTNANNKEAIATDANKNSKQSKIATIAIIAEAEVIDSNQNEPSIATIATIAEVPNTKEEGTIATIAINNKKSFYNNTIYNNSYSSNNLLNSDSESAAILAIVASVHEEPAIVEKPATTYIIQRMAELGLSKEDIRGETDPTLALDPEELNDIRENKQLFDTWIEHVHRHKQLKTLELAKQKQAEQYDLGDTLGSLPFDHKLKFVEHVLTTFKKFFLTEHYAGQKPDHLFCEMWFLRNEDLTLAQIFNASAELIRLAKLAIKNSDSVEYKRLLGVSENLELFRSFCLVESENRNSEVFRLDEAIL